MKKLTFVFMAALFLLAVVAGTAKAVDDIEEMYVYLNGHYVSEDMKFSVERGDVLGIRVLFTTGSFWGEKNDIRVKAWIDGYRDEISAETERFDIYGSTTYSKYLSLRIPDDIDKGTYTLYVLITGKKELSGDKEKRLTLKIQRTSYELDVLSVDLALPATVNAGEAITADVVVKNTGSQKIDDIFVEAAIPELGLSKRIYIGDLYPNDYIEEGERDTKKVTVTFTIPESAETGTYTFYVKAYDEDASAEAEEYFNVVGKQVKEEVQFVAEDYSKDVKAGETVTYKLIVANTGEETKPYTIEVEGTRGWATVNVEPKTFILAKDGIQTITLTLNIDADAVNAEHVFAVKLTSDGEVLKTINLAANIESEKPKTTELGLWLAVIILAIAVIVLAVVLATTQKGKAEEKPEEVYY